MCVYLAWLAGLPYITLLLILVIFHIALLMAAYCQHFFLFVNVYAYWGISWHVPCF